MQNNAPFNKLLGNEKKTSARLVYVLDYLIQYLESEILYGEKTSIFIPSSMARLPKAIEGEQEFEVTIRVD